LILISEFGAYKIDFRTFCACVSAADSEVNPVD